MLGERKFRMSQRGELRRASGGSGAEVFTPEDAQNLDAFSVKLTEATELLEDEINAINQGDLGIISENYERKSDVLKWLELKMPLIEPFLKLDAAKERQLDQKLLSLKQKVTENSELLSRMAMAAGTVVREMEKAAERHSLSGLYGKTGQKLGGDANRTMSVDRKF